MSRQVSRRHALQLGCIATSGVLAGCLATQPSFSDDGTFDTEDWPMHRRDPGNTGHAGNESGPLSTVEPLWTHEISQGAFGESTVVGETIYVGGFDFRVHAIATDDGTERWTAHTDAPVGSTPAVTDEMVYVLNSSSGALGDGVGIVRGLAVEDGLEEWMFELGNNVLRISPTVVGERVYAADRRTVYALNARNGHLVWQTSLDEVAMDHNHDYTIQPDAYSLAVRDGAVYVGGRQVISLDAASGEHRWTANTGSGRPVAVRNGHVYAVRETSLIALDASDGTEAWTATPEVTLKSPPATDGERVYVGGGPLSDANPSQAGILIAISASDGAIAWRAKAEEEIVNAPTVADETIYVATGTPGSSSTDKTLRALNVDDGSDIWKLETGDSTYSSPAVTDETIYANDGKIRALGP